MYLNEELFTDFLATKEILWLGIDFSQAKFTRKGFDLSNEVLRIYFHEWNMLIISDQKKYDIRVSFRKPIMSYDLSMVTKSNKTIKPNHILCENININNTLDENYIQQYLQKLQYPKIHKYALLFIVESFDNHSKTGSVWVAIVNTELNTPVLFEKFIKVPSGFGTKNYWARIFYNLLYDIQNYTYYRWENLVKTNS